MRGGGGVPCIRGRWSGQGRTAVVVSLIDKVARVVRDSMWSLWCPLANRFELIGATREMFSFCCYPPPPKKKEKKRKRNKLAKHCPLGKGHSARCQGDLKWHFARLANGALPAQPLAKVTSASW